MDQDLFDGNTRWWNAELKKMSPDHLAIRAQALYEARAIIWQELNKVLPDDKKPIGTDTPEYKTRLRIEQVIRRLDVAIGMLEFEAGVMGTMRRSLDPELSQAVVGFSTKDIAESQEGLTLTNAELADHPPVKLSGVKA